MKTNDLKKMTTQLKKLANGKNSLPVLDNVLFMNGKIIASNLEQYLIYNDSDIKESFLLDCNMLHKIAEKAKNKEIFFQVNDFNIEVIIEKNVFKFEKLNIEDFPVLPVVTENKLSVNDQWNEDFKRAFKFVADDGLRPVLSGVFISDHIVSTDANKLFFKKQENKPAFDFIIPSEVNKIINDPVIYINYDKEYAELFCNEYSIITRLTKGQYPTWKAVIPQQMENELTFEKSEAIEIIEMALLSANQSSYLIQIGLSEKISVNSQDIDYGYSFSGDLNGKYKGNNMIIGFKGRLLNECLKNIEGNNIKITIQDPTRAVIINDELLLMPMMVNN